MDAQREFEQLDQLIARESRQLAALERGSALQREREALVFDELHASTRLAGSVLSRPELRALVERGRALGEHRLRDYLIAAGYADAARYVAAQTPITARKPRPYARAEEIAELHGRVTAGTGELRAGAWRTEALPAFPGGMVAPPPWKIATELRAFVDRIASGPPADTSRLLWVSDAFERFARLQPFASANGRVGRLVANLLLRRLDLPPFIVPHDAAAYFTALRSADAGNPWPLATLIARSVSGGLARLLAAGNASDALQALSRLAATGERAALYKAAQRGRLRTVRRDGNLYTTPAWLAAYRTTRSAAGRRSPPGPPG